LEVAHAKRNTYQVEYASARTLLCLLVLQVIRGKDLVVFVESKVGREKQQPSGDAPALRTCYSNVEFTPVYWTRSCIISWSNFSWFTVTQPL
jgi:hypothetical protein